MLLSSWYCLSFILPLLFFITSSFFFTTPALYDQNVAMGRGLLLSEIPSRFNAMAIVSLFRYRTMSSNSGPIRVCGTGLHQEEANTKRSGQL